MTASVASTVSTDQAGNTPPVLADNTQFLTVTDRVTKLLAAAERAVINSREALDQGADLNKMIATALKKSEELRLELVRPIKQAAENIDARFRPIKADLQKAQKLIKGKMDGYLDEQEAIAIRQAEEARKAAEEQALRDAEAEQAAGNTEKADEILTQAAEAPTPAPTPAVSVVRGDMGGGYTRRTDWTFDLDDLSKVPLEYLMLDEKKVKEAIASAKKAETIKDLQIPGLRIFEAKTGVTL